MMKLRGVQFGDYHTADDWGLILNEKIVSPPVPKTNYVSVPGRDGDIDLTEALSGVVNYEDRTAEYTLLLTDGSHADREELITEIVGVLNGQRMQIIDTDDYPDYYMTGRLTVTEVANNNAYGVVKIEAVCNPWRYSINQRKKTVQVTSNDGTLSIILSNGGYKTVTPSIMVTGSVTLTYGATSTTLSEGTYTLPGLRLSPGANSIGVAGSGSVQFSYTEAIF